MPDRKAVRAAHQHLGDMAGREHARERHDAAGDALGEGDHVGLDVPLLDAEPGACASEAGNRLVADHQQLVAGAELAHPLEIAVWRCERRAAGTRDRLQEHGTDGLGSTRDDRGLELGEGVGALFLWCAACADVGAGRGGDRVGIEQRLVVVAARGAGQAEGADGRAVVRRHA